MRLRNVTKNVKEQNWFAVFLDFLIVVLGVFMGIQLGNWNQARQVKASFAESKARFETESKANIESADIFLTSVGIRLEQVKDAVNVLRDCRHDGDALQKVETGINVIRGTGFLNIRTTALEALTGNDGFLSLMKENKREALKEYERNVQQTQKTLDWLEELPFRHHIEDQNYIQFGELTTPPALNGAKIRRLSLSADLGEACKDKNLLKSFYLWERASTFQHLRVTQLKERLEANLD